MRLFGGIFVLSGTFALSAALLGWGGLDSHGDWERLGIGFIGVMHLMGGLVVGWGRSIHVRATRAGVEWTEHRPFRSVTRRTIPPSEIAELDLLTEHDSDGDEVYRVRLRLASGEVLPLSRNGSASREHAEGIRDAVAQRVGRALPA